jgi:hypothetical protein
MKVLYVYKPFYEHDIKSESQQEKVRGSFYSAFGENNPDFTIDVIHFGNAPGLIRTPKEMNEEILKRDFDICIVSEELNFSVEMDVIKKLGKKLFLCCWDTFIATSTDMYINFRVMMKKPRIWGEQNWPIPMAEAAQYCNFIVGDYGKGEIFPNIYGVGNALDTRNYNMENALEENRNIDVGFNGMFYIPERAKYYEIFQKANIPVTYTGSCNKSIYPAQVLDNKNFADIFKKTKISLAYTESIFGPNNKQRKGRPFEIAACGSFMLSTHPAAYKFKNLCWFEEGVHYDSMDENNCVDKVRYYLANPEKRIAMAKAMNEHFLNNYTPLHWWQDIFKWAKQ